MTYDEVCELPCGAEVTARFQKNHVYFSIRDFGLPGSVEMTSPEGDGLITDASTEAEILIEVTALPILIKFLLDTYVEAVRRAWKVRK